MWIALAGPLVAYLWKDRRASIGGVLPLSLMAVAVFLLRSNIVSLGSAQRRFAGEGIADQVITELFRSLNPSLSLGFYISVAAAVWFAYRAVRAYLTSQD